MFGWSSFGTVSHFSSCCLLICYSFTCKEVHKLVDALDFLPAIQYGVSHIYEDRITGMCMLLHCIAYPSRLVNIEMQFGWEKSHFSRVTSHCSLDLESLEASSVL